MKPFYTVVALLALASPVLAQLNKVFERMRESKEVNRDTTEAAARLGAAITGRSAVESSLNQAKSQEGAQTSRIQKAEADLTLVPNPRETALKEQGERSMAAAMKNVTPEAEILIAQGNAVGPTSAPAKPEAATEDSAPPGITPPRAGGGAGPKPLKVTSLADPNTAGGVKTTITCTGATFFDANKMIAIFSDNVEVRHPQFFISCDELEVHMVKEDGAKPGAAAKAKPPNPAPAAPPVEVATPENATGVKFAIARGRMVVIEKLTETGELQVGKCRHATFEGSTEDMLLRDFPQVQRGNTLQVATDPSTTMTIKKNGQFSASGPSRTDIVKDVPTKKKTTLGTPAAPVPSPNPSPQ